MKNAVGWIVLIGILLFPVLRWWIKMRVQAGMTGRAVERARRKRERDEGED